MEAKLLRTDLADYRISEYTGNKSGYVPIGDRVLVLVDISSDITAGGVHLPEDVTYRHTMASETGVIVALGEAAFKWNFDRTREWYGIKPKVGDRVYIERYGGKVIRGKDEKMYRILDDKCVAAIEG